MKTRGKDAVGVDVHVWKRVWIRGTLHFVLNLVATNDEKRDETEIQKKQDLGLGVRI